MIREDYSKQQISEMFYKFMDDNNLSVPDIANMLNLNVKSTYNAIAPNFKLDSPKWAVGMLEVYKMRKPPERAFVYASEVLEEPQTDSEYRGTLFLMNQGSWPDFQDILEIQNQVLREHGINTIHYSVVIMNKRMSKSIKDEIIKRLNKKKP